MIREFECMKKILLNYTNNKTFTIEVTSSMMEGSVFHLLVVLKKGNLCVIDNECFLCSRK